MSSFRLNNLFIGQKSLGFYDELWLTYNPTCVLLLHVLYVKVTRWLTVIMHMNIYGYISGVLKCPQCAKSSRILKVGGHVLCVSTCVH